MLSIATRLKRLGACDEAVEWSKPYKADTARAWAECENGSHMLWLLGRKSGPPESDSRKALVLCACECARLALPHTKDPRVLACIETAEKWARGEASIEELWEARKAAAACAAYAAYAAACAAACAACAACAAYAAACAAACAACAACAAYAAYAARATTLKACDEIVRKHYPEPPK